jgi:hypothetical protein
LRIISERIVPQLVPAINLEEHSKQTKFSTCDEFASEIWAGYLGNMIKRNDKELAAIFKRVSEEVMGLGLWVHPYKLITNVCRALATSDWGRSFLNKFSSSPRSTADWRRARERSTHLPEAIRDPERPGLRT